MLVKKLQGNGPLEPRNTRYVRGSGCVQGMWGPCHLVCLGLTTARSHLLSSAFL